MDILDLVVNLFTNTDAFLVSLATDYGTLIYAAMFLIFFLETGFVIMSFLPGASLLFVAGTVAASGTASPWLIMLAVIVGAIAGNTLGYEQGRWLGNRIYSGNISWINDKKLRHAHDFYMRHGGKTILLARFVPIVRAFAPLIAGAARMNGIRFELFSGAGAILWAVSIVGAGYLFGNIPFIKNNLSLILLLGIIAAISGPVLVGMVWKFIQKRKGLDAEDPQSLPDRQAFLHSDLSHGKRKGAAASFSERMGFSHRQSMFSVGSFHRHEASDPGTHGLSTL